MQSSRKMPIAVMLTLLKSSRLVQSGLSEYPVYVAKSFTATLRRLPNAK